MSPPSQSSSAQERASQSATSRFRAARRRLHADSVGSPLSGGQRLCTYLTSSATASWSEPNALMPNATAPAASPAPAPQTQRSPSASPVQTVPPTVRRSAPASSELAAPADPQLRAKSQAEASSRTSFDHRHDGHVVARDRGACRRAASSGAQGWVEGKEEKGNLKEEMTRLILQKRWPLLKELRRRSAKERAAAERSSAGQSESRASNRKRCRCRMERWRSAPAVCPSSPRSTAHTVWIKRWASSCWVRLTGWMCWHRVRRMIAAR